MQPWLDRTCMRSSRLGYLLGAQCGKLHIQHEKVITERARVADHIYQRYIRCITILGLTFLQKGIKFKYQKHNLHFVAALQQGIKWAYESK